MRASTAFVLAATALAGMQGCTQPPVPMEPVPAPLGPPMAEPPPPQPSDAAMPVVNRRLAFRDGPGAFISSEDYPAAAREARLQGTVGFRLAVSPQGRVTHCTVLQSSGHSILDAHLCSLLTRRARFSPATDADGNPIGATIDGHYDWKLPDGR